MRVLAVILAALIVLIQYPLWLGRGGWLQVWDLDRQFAGKQAETARLQARNDALDGEVRDLRTGIDALEERARFELGMVKRDEVFFQYVDPAKMPDKPAGAP